MRPAAPDNLEPNAAELAADARRERAVLSSLTLPSSALVLVVLIGPFGWLTLLSFVDQGGFSLVHYQRIMDRSYATTFLTTLEMAALVTLWCGIVGYPLSYFIAGLSRRWAALALFCVLLPFWTAILVRTYAWVILLQRRGILNTWLTGLGLIDEPLRLAHNFTGTVIGLVHILLPFLVLPLLAAMKKVPPDLLIAAASLGASPRRAFWDVFFPLSLPGFVGGVVIVFVLCLGSYVTPTILGGGRVIVWPMRVADAVNIHYNWGAAAALGVVLLVVTLGLIGGLSRILRVDLLAGERR